MMNELLHEAEARRALVLLVDPRVESRHGLWRILSKAFGVLEAATAEAARQWIAERPDIDALIVEDELPDARGHELVDELEREAHPIAEHAIVLASRGPGARAERERHVVEPGDVPAILSTLTSWFVARDVAEAHLLLRDLRQFPESGRRIRAS